MWVGRDVPSSDKTDLSPMMEVMDKTNSRSTLKDINTRGDK